MKVITVGGAMVDAIAVIDDDRIERLLMENAGASFLMVESGRKIEAREISQHCGGGGVNTAVAMARLGHDAAALLKLGRDQRAETILRRLADEGVSTRWVSRDAAEPTGASVMIASHDRDAAIFTFRGANTRLRLEDIHPDTLSADLVYIAGLSNEAAACFPEIVRRAKQLGAAVATNPGVRQLTRKTGDFFGTLPEIDILSINRTEAAALLPHLADRFGEGGAALLAADAASTPELARYGLASADFEMSLRKFLSCLHALGVGTVLLTDGARGAYASGGGVLRHRKAAAAQVVGTAGAGDAFASTFAVWLRETEDAGAALRAATLNAASVIGHADTQTGLLTRGVLIDRMSAADGSDAETVWRSDAFAAQNAAER